MEPLLINSFPARSPPDSSLWFTWWVQLSNSEDTGLIYATKGASGFTNVTEEVNDVSTNTYCKDAVTVMSTVLDEGVENMVSVSSR